jgi:putative MATE family efflux protein
MYLLVDRVFVGRALGDVAIAATTVAFPCMLVLMAFGMLIGIGGTALVSIRLGQQRREEAEQVLANATLLMLGVSLVLTILGSLLLDPLLRLFGASDTVLPYARDYMQIIVLGTVFQIMGFGLNAIIRGEGNPRVAMITMLLGVVLNAVTAPILIFGLHWGMRGAAIATVFSQAVSTLWVLWYFLRGRSVLKLRAGNLRLQWPICVTIVALGSPLFAMQLAASVSNSLLNNQLRIYGGDRAVSVMGIIYAMVMITLMPIFGINQGAQPIIGFNYGAQRFDRVKKALQTAVLAASGIALLGYSVAMLFPGLVIALFTEHDPALSRLGRHAIRLSMIMLPIVGFQIVSASYFQAVGKPKHAMLLSLSRQVLLLIPAVLILPRFFGLDGVWLALPVADFCSSLLTGIWLYLELRQLYRRHAEIEVSGQRSAISI